MNFLKKAAAVVTTAAATVPAFAVTDFTPISSAFSATDIVTGILAVAAIVAVIYTAWRGSKIILGMIRG